MQESSSIQCEYELPSNGKSSRLTWYLIIVALTFSCVLLVVVLGETGTLSYIRYISGSVLVLFLPGYAFLRALSPIKAVRMGEEKQIDGASRLALSIVASIAMVSIIGLILDLFPWGVNLNSLVSSISLFTLAFSTIGLAREQLNR